MGSDPLQRRIRAEIDPTEPTHNRTLDQGDATGEATISGQTGCRIHRVTPANSRRSDNPRHESFRRQLPSLCCFDIDPADMDALPSASVRFNIAILCIIIGWLARGAGFPLVLSMIRRGFGQNR
jgi:hypothetical protein